MKSLHPLACGTLDIVAWKAKGFYFFFLVSALDVGDVRDRVKFLFPTLVSFRFSSGFSSMCWQIWLFYQLFRRFSLRYDFEYCLQVVKYE